MNKLFFLFFLALIGSIYAIGTPCGGNEKELRISDCKIEPCIFKKGSTGTLEIDFTTSSDTKTVEALITTKVLGREVKWPGMNTNGCQNSNLVCPLKGQVPQTYKYNYKISPLFPPITTRVKITLKNESGNLDACYFVNVKLV